MIIKKIILATLMVLKNFEKYIILPLIEQIGEHGMYKESGTLYNDIYNDLVAKIEQGLFSEGEKMPTEREMCSIYKVSRITVRQAFALLEEDGYLSRKQGKGSFVKRGRINQQLTKLYSMRSEIVNRGLLHIIKVVSFEIVPSDIVVSHHMKCDENTPMYKLERIFYIDEKPYTFETNYLPVAAFKSEITRDAIEKNGLYNTLSALDLAPTNAEEKLFITLPSKEQALSLQCKIDDPCMRLQRCTFSNGILVEYSVNIVRGDIFEYSISLK